MKIIFCKLRGWSVIRLMVAAQYKIIEHFKQDKGSKTCASFPQLNSQNTFVQSLPGLALLSSWLLQGCPLLTSNEFFDVLPMLVVVP